MEVKKILSVSVASYNLGDMIKTNIESFCKSPVAEEIELIITDDGSKDNTPDIIEEYTKVYPNIVRLVRKKNEGPGSTVNSGILNATGKYFRMVDGDDWVNTENLEAYITYLKQSDADMIITNYDIYDNSIEKVIETAHWKELPPNQTSDFKDLYTKIPKQMHAITFKTEILKQNNICLDNCFYTDVEYLLFPIPYVHTVSYLDLSIYVYRIAQANQSVSPESMKKNIFQHDMVFKHLLKFYNEKKNGLSAAHREFITDRISLMADVQLGTLLLFDSSKENKGKIKSFIQFVKTESSEVFNKFKTSKKYRSLTFCGYLFYPIISKKYKKIFASKKSNN